MPVSPLRPTAIPDPIERYCTYAAGFSAPRTATKPGYPEEAGRAKGLGGEWGRGYGFGAHRADTTWLCLLHPIFICEVCLGIWFPSCLLLFHLPILKRYLVASRAKLGSHAV